MQAIFEVNLANIGCQKNGENELFNWSSGDSKEITVDFEVDERCTNEVSAYKAFWENFSTKYYAGNSSYSRITLKLLSIVNPVEQYTMQG